MKFLSFVLILAVSLPLMAMGCSSEGGGAGAGISRILGQAFLNPVSSDEARAPE